MEKKLIYKILLKLVLYFILFVLLDNFFEIFTVSTFAPTYTDVETHKMYYGENVVSCKFYIFDFIKYGIPSIMAYVFLGAKIFHKTEKLKKLDLLIYTILFSIPNIIYIYSTSMKIDLAPGIILIILSEIILILINKYYQITINWKEKINIVFEAIIIFYILEVIPQIFSTFLDLINIGNCPFMVIYCLVLIINFSLIPLNLVNGLISNKILKVFLTMALLINFMLWNGIKFYKTIFANFKLCIDFFVLNKNIGDLNNLSILKTCIFNISCICLITILTMEIVKLNKKRNSFGAKDK